MAVFVYAPEVRIHIRTSKSSAGKGKIIDVTQDISRGSVTRVLNGISSAEWTLLNQGRKYDGMFSPMDSVSIRLRRLKPVLKFTGYLNYSPIWTAEPGSISLRASCTLKRLANFVWDPTAAPSATLLNTPDPNASHTEDGGSAQRAINVMNKVAGWPLGQIHISRVPTDWFDTVGKLADQLIAEAETLAMQNVVGSGAWIDGSNPMGAMTGTTPGIGAGTGHMPATSGKCSEFGVEANHPMGLTGEMTAHPRDNWYCAMRWPYTNSGAVRGAKDWWRNRHIMVVNPKNNKAVVVRAADWGPAAWTGRVIDLSPTALHALGANTDDVVHMGFAAAGSAPGKVSAASAALGSILGTQPQIASGGGASGVSSGWGVAGDRANMVQAKAAGHTFTVHRLAKRNFEGFVNELQSGLGYHPKSIGGFANRNVAGTTHRSNHAYGAAIDIDPTKNPRYGNASGGRYALPHPPAIITLARKWGLYWGGEYKHSKDYMHFEVIGAPQTPSVSGAGAAAGAAAAAVVVQKWRPPIHGTYHVSAHFGTKGGSWADGHTGTDFSNYHSGGNIYPVGPGTVSDHGSGDEFYGNHVSIDHGGKIWTYYAHMNAPSSVPVGSHVTQNTVIGHIGETGNAHGPHVHVELRRGSDTYAAAKASGGIEKYVLGGANRSDPPAGTESVSGDYASDSAASDGMDVAQLGMGLFNVFQYNLQQVSLEGTLLGGYRALLNDVPVLDTVGQFLGSSLRDYCSAPNGDFIAWFPDYFGLYKQAGKMLISPLEVKQESGPPSIGWSDDNLKTHQFVAGATMGGVGDADSILRTQSTAGIASVEFPEVMRALFKISEKEAEDLATDYLMRMGARPDFTPMNQISGGRQEFFMACWLFQQNWSQQFQATVNLTFMPELYPGMLVCFPEYGIQGYIRQTTDSFDLRDGGEFSTDVSAAPWSSIKGTKSVVSMLPKGAAL